MRIAGICSFLCFWESNPSIWNLSVYLEPASSKRYYFAQWTLEHFIRTKSTAWREIESMRVDAVILSSDVCCQKTYACWSREHGSRTWQLLWVMPWPSCLQLFSIVQWFCSCEVSIHTLEWLCVENYILVLSCISVLSCENWCYIRFQFAVIAEWHAFLLISWSPWVIKWEKKGLCNLLSTNK